MRVRAPWRPTLAVTQALVLLLPACAGDPPELPPRPQGVSERTARVYATRCATCHGTEGHGDGPAAQGLSKRPRDFGDALWQSYLTDERLERIIIDGGAAHGLSNLMPKNLDLKAEPELVAELLALLRGFGQSEPTELGSATGSPSAR